MAEYSMAEAISKGISGTITKEGKVSTDPVKITTRKRGGSGGGSKTYIITPQDKLTDAEIIEQNQKLLEDKQEEIQVEKSRGNTRRVEELTEQYNDIARQYNQAVIKEEEKAEIVSEFANLYQDQPEKARDIVEQSGYKDYLKVSERSFSLGVQGGGVSPPPPPKYKLDPKSNVWVFQGGEVSSDYIGSGGQINALERPQPETFKDKAVSFLEKASDPFYLIRSPQRTLERFDAFSYDLGSAQEILSEKTKEVTYSSDPFSSVKGTSFLAAGVVVGGARFVVDTVKNPFGLVEGTAELISDPVGTGFQVGEQFIEDPAGTVGYFGAQGVIFAKTPKVIQKGREAVFEVKLERGRAYDLDYKFGEQNLRGSGQTQLYFDETVRSEPVSAFDPIFRSDYSIQRQFPKAEVYSDSLVKTPYGSEKISVSPFDVRVLESGKVEIVETPSVSTELSRARALQEQSSRGSAPLGDQTTLPAGTVKPKDYFIKVEAGDKKIVQGEFVQVATGEKGGVRSGVGVTVAELTQAGIKDIFSKFDEGRAVKKQTPAVIEGARVIEGTNRLIDTPNVRIFIPQGDLRPTETPIKPITEKPSSDIIIEQKAPERLVFEPVSKYSLKSESLVDIKIDTKSKTKSKSGLTLIQDPIIIQDQIVYQEPVIVTERAQIQEPFQVTEGGGFKPKTTPRVTPPPIFKARTPEASGGKVLGFNVAIRRKGKFGIETDKPLRREEAINFGTERVGKSSAATFKLIPTKTSRLGKFSGGGNIKDFYQKGGLFIEKRSRRIKSREEKEEITLKGLASLRLGKKKIKGVFN